jgi:hypothetical protein
MAQIKSALEVALERTEQVRSDRGSIELYKAKQQGMKLANQFLADTAFPLEAEIKKTPREQRASLNEGLLDGLLARLSLPYLTEDLKPLEAVGKALALALPNKGPFLALYKTFLRQIAQFPEEYKQYDRAIRQQYAPALRQKEEALSKQLGYAVKLDPMQDPEFTAFYNQNMQQLKAGYETLIAQVKQAAVE